MARRIRAPEKSDMKLFQEQLMQAAAADEWRHYQCASVTPLYGGGVKAGEVDKAMPIRASAIRGQLRFWWRIACGPFADPQEMFRRETTIWGGIAEAGPTASKVKVRVAGAPIDSTVPCCSPKNPPETSKKKNGAPIGSKALCHSSLDSDTGTDSDTGIKYAFGPAAIKGDVEWLKPGYTFELSLSYTDSEVETALRWWASFGGMGARTRRGFGAVEIVEIFDMGRKSELQNIGIDEVKNSGCRLVLGSSVDDAITAWKDVNEKMRLFRQGAGVGRKAKDQGQTDGAAPGRSHWPEPDAIRQLTQQWFGKNGLRRHLVKKMPVGDPHDHAPMHGAGNSFPRAAFGLPIIFKFKDEGEPASSTLVPDGKERMASPLILRPYWNGTHWQAAALLLPGWEKVLSQPLKFKERKGTPDHWPADSKSRQEKARHIQPMMKGGADDPLSAFMHYFEKG